MYDIKIDDDIGARGMIYVIQNNDRLYESLYNRVRKINI